MTINQGDFALWLMDIVKNFSSQHNRHNAAKCDMM